MTRPAFTKLPRYPWKKWLTPTGKPWKSLSLIRGKHYNCMTHSMAVQVRQAAYTLGVSVSVSIGEDRLIITNQGKRSKTKCR